MHEPSLYLPDSDEYVPLFPELSNDEVMAIFRLVERGAWDDAIYDLRWLTECSALDAKRFVMHHEKIRKARNLPGPDPGPRLVAGDG
jgi:hypothetical protein